MGKNKSIGALWVKQNETRKWLSGVITVGDKKISIVIFKNENKKSDKSPDYTILEAYKREVPFDSNEAIC